MFDSQIIQYFYSDTSKKDLCGKGILLFVQSCIIMAEGMMQRDDEYRALILAALLHDISRLILCSEFLNLGKG